MLFEDFKYLPQPVEEYLHHLSIVKGKSQLTIKEYASDLRMFFRFLVAEKIGSTPEQLGTDYDLSYIDIDFISAVSFMDAYRFLDYCAAKRDNDIASRARKISSIRGLFKYLCTYRKLIKENPMLQLETPKTRKKLPKYLTLEQSLELLAAVDGKYKQRDFCMLTLLLNCGMRLAELVGINIPDIDFELKTLIVTGKGNKQRLIYLNKACMEAVIEYLKVRPHDGLAGADRNALFISYQKKRISRRMVQETVYKYLDKIGLEGQGYSVHKLRHTAATLMYQHGNVDVLVLKDVLGHENLSTTEIYTHILNEQLRDAAKNNPLSGESPAPENGKSKA